MIQPSVTWVQGERATDHKHHRVDVFAESGEHHRQRRLGSRNVAPEFDDPASRLYSLLLDRLSIRGRGI
jgi:hypothetical protein